MLKRRVFNTLSKRWYWKDDNSDSLFIHPSKDDPNFEPMLGLVKMWATVDDINGSRIYFRAKGKFASLTDSLGMLSYVAKEIGVIGNTITIEYVDSEGSGNLLAVTVNGNTISVQLETTENAVAATITSVGGGNADLTFTAKIPGSDGNQLSIYYASPIVDKGTTEASVDGDIIVVDLAGTANVQASMIIDNPAANSDIVATRPLGNWLGASGNCGGGGEPSRAGTMTSSGIANNTIINNGGDLTYGTLVTAQEAVDFSAANPNDQFVLTLAPGSDGTGLIVNSSIEVIPTGGVDVEITATASNVLDAIELDAGSNALISVAYAPGRDGSGIIYANGWQLNGGVDADSIITTASMVKAAIDASAAADIVAVNVLVNEQMSAMSAENFSGGNSEIITEWGMWTD